MKPACRRVGGGARAEVSESACSRARFSADSSRGPRSAGPSGSLELMQRIAIDMDEVIADTLGNFIKTYNADFGRNLTKAELHGRRVMEIAAPEDVQRIRDYFKTEKFFAEIEVMEDSQDVVRDLAGKYEVFITTAAMEVP